jgi:L-threonylcarbamoyladenylate synthase
MARILPPTDRAIGLAVERLRAGEMVGVPTETVYGLAADAMNEAAVRSVFALKGRPSDNPLIVHVLDAAQAKDLVTAWDARCDAMAARFWPGPLTLVLPKVATVPDVVTAGYSTVAVRAPAHEVMHQLLEAFAGALAAPSANRASGVSPTTAAHVAEEFPDCEELIVLDGGPCEVGIESTVLDVTRTPARVLRPGGVSIEALRDVIGEVEASGEAAQAQSPGTSPRHYAPRTRCELVSSGELRERLHDAIDRVAVVSFGASVADRTHFVIALPRDAQRYAAMLYDALRQADASGADRILIERPTETAGLWMAIQDRLQRATAPRS